MIGIKEASEYLGVTQQTLRVWDKEGKLVAYRTPRGTRRYDKDELDKFMGVSKEVKDERITVGYARVSSRDQKNDLDKQISVIELFCASKGWSYNIISDIGSGLNYSKKGLRELIDMIEDNKVARIVINYKDRLLRYGFEIIEQIASKHNTEIIIISDTDGKSYEEELVQDVLSIITVYSSKLYGSRSHKNKEIIAKNKEMFK